MFPPFLSLHLFHVNILILVWRKNTNYFPFLKQYQSRLAQEQKFLKSIPLKHIQKNPFSKCSTAQALK